MRNLPIHPVETRVDIIWNMTLVCPWDCKICCVDAVHVRRQEDHILLSSSGLMKHERVPHSRQDAGSIYDIASQHQQRRGLELDFAGKMRVLEHLKGFAPKVDISGGDPLSVSENFEIMRHASARLGKQNVTLTATGTGLLHRSVEEVASLIGEYNFTYDSAREDDASDLRPQGYARGNLRKATQFARHGVRTRAECPLTRENLQLETLNRIYGDLCDAGIGKLLVMRLFPVGRGGNESAATPTSDEYRRAINHLRDLELRLKGPAIRLQCALKHLDGGVKENPCDLVRESFGLMADGTLLASPWAVDGKGRALDDAFVLGNLACTPLRDILSSEKVALYRRRLDDNLGHCKIFSYFHGTSTDPLARLFENADPLYTNVNPKG